MGFSAEELLAQMNSRGQGSVWETLGITLIEANKDRVVATLTIDSRHHQPLGYLHGGVSVLLAETVASVGSMLNIDMQKQMAFGQEINANHVRPKRDGLLTATAIPVHLGRTTHIWDIRLTDEQQKLICISRCTVAVVNRSPEEK